MLAVNYSTKYIYLTALNSLVEHIDKPVGGAVSVPLGEPITTVISRIVDKYAFLSTPEGHVSYMGVSNIAVTWHGSKSRLCLGGFRPVNCFCFVVLNNNI